MTGVRKYPLLLLVLSLAVVAVAQDVSTPTPYIEEIEVRVVSIDVVVTDAQGRPLTGLTRDDFELLEAGKPMNITYFSRIEEGRLDTEEVGAAADASPRSPIIWAVYVDQTNIKAGRRNQALRELRTFLTNVMGEGDRAIVATYDGHAFRVRTGVTADRAFLLQMLQTLEKERLHLGPAAVQEVHVRAQIENVVDPYEEGLVVARDVNTIVDAEALRTRNAIAGMDSLLDVLAGVDARTAIVYVGAGFNSLPGLSITETFRRKLPMLAEGIFAPKPEDRRFELEKYLSQLAERVSATRATVYSIHAGDPGVGLLGPEDKGHMAAVGSILGEDAQLIEAGSVHEMAARTGGRAFVANAKLSEQLAMVASDLTHYYSLGYSPTGEAGRLRDVRVRVKRPGARVRHREAVRERSKDEEAGDAAVTALFNPSNDNPLAVRVEAQPRRGRTLPVRVEVPLDSLTFLPLNDGHRAGLVFHFALAGKDGSVRRLDSRELPLLIPRQDFAKALRQNVSYAVEVPMQGGGMRLAVSVQDRIGQVRSIVTLPLDAQ